MIFLNGVAIKEDQWSGVGTNICTLELDIYEYDHLIIKQ